MRLGKPLRLMNFLNRHRRAFLIVVCAICTGIVAFAHWINFLPLVHLEGRVRDFLTQHGRRSPTQPDLLFLAIDGVTVSLDDAFPEEIAESPALRSMKDSGWPWSRDTYAKVIERLVNAGARLVVFDMLFPTERPGDDELKAALDRYRDKVVIGANFVDSPDERTGTSTKRIIVPTQSLVPSGDPLDDRVGYVSFWPELDDIVRTSRYRITEYEVNGWQPAPDSRLLHSLTGRALSKLGHEELVPRDPRCIRFAKGFTTRPLWEIFSKMWERPPYNKGELFRDKIVLIGPLGDWAHDVLNTPLGIIPGPELHLHSLNAALNRDFVHEPSRLANLASIVLAGFAAWALSTFIRQPFLRFTLFILGSAAWYFLAHFVFSLHSGATILSIAPPLLAANSSGLVWLILEQVIDRLEKARTRRTLERYVSKDLVREILDNPASLLTALGGVRKSVAILFSDLRGFTTLTEEADSAQLVAQLNEYFTAMVERIFSNKGIVDKFIGDAIMAVWGEIQSDGPANDVERAVTAALQMQTALAELNVGWAKRGIRPFRMGLGINFGPVIVGNIGATGATEKMELTIIGDPVNLASRLESLTKEYHLELLLGESAADLVADIFPLQLVDLVCVKGKTKPNRVYTVLGAPREPLPENLRTYLARYNEALQHYRSCEFAAAIASFHSSIESRPDDPLAKIYIERCHALLEKPPKPEWDGVFVMTKK